MKRQQVRQGDVLLLPVDTIPDSAKPVPPSKGPIHLAFGEVTNHAHSLYGRATMFREDGTGGAVFIVAEKGTVLGHGTPTDGDTLPRDPDHGPIALDGAYRVVRQVEFPRAAPARQVAD